MSKCGCFAACQGQPNTEVYQQNSFLHSQCFYCRDSKCLSFETMQCTSVISHGKWRLPGSFLKCEPVCLLPKPHTHKHMYVSSNYLVKLLIIPISLPPSFIRKEEDSRPTKVTLSPVSTSTDANLPIETLKSWIKDYLASLVFNLEL